MPGRPDRRPSPQPSPGVPGEGAGRGSLAHVPAGSAQVNAEQDIFSHSAAFDPAQDLEALLAQVPARWVVYLLADADHRPIQLLCVKNLKASLRRRLGGAEPVGPTRKTRYRDVVRHIHWRRVDSALEGDWIYLEAARRIFPQTYRGMLGLDAAWFVHVDPDAPFPRFVKTKDLADRPGMLLGPLPDKHAAGRLVELMEDVFDLCRYHSILVQAPRGKACAYKEMGKCPAPCDGSISMEQYHAMVLRGLAVLQDPQSAVREHTRRMEAAAAALRFESAAKIKAFVEQLSELGQGAYRHVRPLSDFAFLSLQRGPWARTAKAFLITPGRIEHVASLIGEPKAAGDLLRCVLERAQSQGRSAIDPAGAERIALVSQHLFGARAAQGALLRLSELGEQSLRRAWRDVQKRKAEPEADEEGVVKELGL